MENLSQFSELGQASDASTPVLSAVIVSFNTSEMTRECLRVLTEELVGLDAEVIVVDNGSKDDSVTAVRHHFPEVKVVANDHNLGFGAANNAAFARARGRYLLLLNSDAFPRPGAVATLVRFLDQHPSVGVAGPRVLNPDGSLQRSCYRFTTPLQAWLENLWLGNLFPTDSAFGDYQNWDHRSEREVDFCIGACLLVRGEIYRQIGGFDERFFMYQEEADWQKRIRGAGWQVMFTPSAEIIHIAGASGKEEPVRINQHFFESLDKYVLKHHGLLGFLHLRVAMLVGCLLRWVGWSAVALLPARRRYAEKKARHHAKLFGRQSLTRPPSSKRA